MKLTVFVKPKNRVLANDRSSLEYVQSFYTPDELQKFEADLIECASRGWVSHCDDSPKLSIDIPGNAFVAEYTGDNIQAFIDYFVVERQNFKPVQDYFRDHPEDGSAGYAVS